MIDEISARTLKEGDILIWAHDGRFPDGTLFKFIKIEDDAIVIEHLTNSNEITAKGYHERFIFGMSARNVTLHKKAKSKSRFDLIT